MLKRQKNSNRDISKATRLLDFFPVLIFLWPLGFGIWNFSV
jgi:hypothetical protein